MNYHSEYSSKETTGLQVTWNEAWCKEFHPRWGWCPSTFAPCWSRPFAMPMRPFSSPSSITGKKKKIILIKEI